MKNLQTFRLFESSTFNEDKLENYLSKFPDNATTWALATDELPDMYSWMQEENEDLQPVGRKNCHTPAEWNTKYKKAIREGIKSLSSESKNEMVDRFPYIFK